MWQSERPKNGKSLIGGFTAEVYNEFDSDLTKLHYSTSKTMYEERLSEFRDKYKEHEQVMLYMEAQWLTGSFSNWQIFCNVPGYANTNSNIESFNATFKRDYTKFFKCTMLTAVKKLFQCIVDYSNRADTMNTFWESPKFDKDIKEAASKLVKSQFKKNGKYSKKVTYCSVYDKITFEIRLDDERCFKSSSCSCSTFTKWALCKHIVAYSNLNSLDLYGARYRQPENFTQKTKRGAHKKISQALVRDE